MPSFNAEPKATRSFNAEPKATRANLTHNTRPSCGSMKHCAMADIPLAAGGSALETRGSRPWLSNATAPPLKTNATAPPFKTNAQRQGLRKSNAPPFNTLASGHGSAV